MSLENVKLHIENSVAILTVDRPKALNALNAQTLREIRQAVEQVEQDGSVRALIVTGAGEKAFVAGADIAEMAAMTSEEGRRFSALGHEAMARLESLRIPTIAAVNGFALGGGCELALACDLIYASEKAKLGLPEVGLGVIPGFGGTQRLTRIVGKQRAKELVFTGDMLDAKTAKELGLVLDVIAPEKLMEHCKNVAQKVASKGPLAVSQAKRMIESGSNVDLNSANKMEQQAFGLLFGTHDQKEGMKAFLEKRSPSYTGN